jgi:hypothetical protein
MHARVGDVEARAEEPRRPLDPARVVRDLVPRALEWDAEVGDHRTPEPVGLVDRDAMELVVARASEGTGEAPDVR